MEPPPPSSTTTVAGGCGKLRLMCSYGGYIVPRPGSKSLCYAGGDTRIVAVDRRSITTLDLLVSHLSVTLCVNFSFSLKYQLPHLDLDSLISLASDEDFQILIDEYDRLYSTSPPAAPSRIRLFLFPINSGSGSGQSVIGHPKTEAWFFDALKSANIMQKGLSEAHGSGSEGHGFVSSGPESIVLETSSSFGSTSSSASLTNLPSSKAQNNEDIELVLQDGKVKLTSTSTVPSDNSVSNIVSHHQNISFQNPVVHASSMETRAYTTETSKLESISPSFSYGIMANNTNMEVGYNTSFPFPHLNQVQGQQVQFLSSYQHMYQQQHPVQYMIYHPNQPYPIYLVPFGQVPPNNLPSRASNQASLLNLNSSCMTSEASQNLRPANSETSFVRVPYCDGSQHQEIDLPPMDHESQNVGMTSTESPVYGNEHEGDLDHVQIYKSQPPPPSLPSQYRTMTKNTKVRLSEGLAQGQDLSKLS